MPKTTAGRCRRSIRNAWPRARSRCQGAAKRRPIPLPRNPAGKLLKNALRGGDTKIHDTLDAVQPLVAHGVLRSFVDAYRIVGNVLAAAGADAVTDESAFLSRCLKTGKQQLLQSRIFSAESISKSLYETGLKLAKYRGLLAANEADARHDFHAEFRHITERLDDILAITLARAEDR